MRITILNLFYAPDISPTAQLSASLAEDRAAQGDRVTVVAGRGGYVNKTDAQDAEPADPNPRIRRIWTPGLGKSSALRRITDYACFYLLAMWRMMRLPRQDVIFAMTTPPFIVVAALLHKLLHPSTRVVLWSMDCYPEAPERAGMIREGSIPSRVMRWINRRIYRRLSHLVTLDTAMTDLLSVYQSPRRPVDATVIANWENASLFPADATHPAWPKAAELGLEGKFVVLYLGNTGVGHNFETVLDAAEKLRDDPVVFLFIGGGKRWDDIADAAKQRSLTNVIMHGYVPKPETPSVMTAADVALITLADEALGVMSPSKLHSNLAMGLPVLYVGPKTSNVDDAITQFGCGVSLQHGQSEQLADHIRELANDPDKRQALSDRARRAFDENYCDTQALRKFDPVIEAVTG